MGVTARLRLLALRVRAVLARTFARVFMAVVPPRQQVLVAGLPDSEENSLVTALALARRFRGRVVLVAVDPGFARSQLALVARALGMAEAAGRVVVVGKRDRGTYGEFLRSAVVAYTHGLYDSPRPAGRRVHVNLWHGSGPKWNANANVSQRIGADVLATCNEPWGREVARALSMPPSTRLVTGNPRQDVMLAGTSREALAALGLDPARPVVLWMPTFRTSARAGSVGLREGEPLGEGADPLLERLVAGCGVAGVQLVLKTHRHDDDDYGRLGVHTLTSDDVLGAGLTLYQLVGLADAMLSDYSSVWVDYLATGRSVALHCPDLAAYEKARGLNDPPLREVAGGLFLETDADVDELVADVAAGRVFRTESLAATVAALGATVGPLAVVPPEGGAHLDSGAGAGTGPVTGSRADAMLDELAAIGLDRFGTDLGLTPPR